MKKEGNRKAQFTVFVILGIVMLVMVFFILFAVTQISNMGAQRERENSINQILDSASINYYVQTCLDSATTTAIDEIMLQGGTLFEEQKGPVRLGNLGETHVNANIIFNNNDELIEINKNITYSIIKNNECTIIDNAPPMYPKINTQLSALYGIYHSSSNFKCFLDSKTQLDLSGFFGKNQLTRLCVQGSKNSDNILGVGPSPCYLNWQKTEDPNKIISIEELLEIRISTLLDNCINFGNFEELKTTNIRLEEESKPEIDVIFNKNSVSIKATYPFIATTNQGEPTSIKKEFNYASPLRVVRLHNYAMSLLAADAKNIYFNLSDNTDQKQHSLFQGIFPNLERYYDPYFQIEILPVTCDPNDQIYCETYKHDRILLIKDTASYVGGRPLTFATIIQNRNPALDVIGTLEEGINYHILVGVNEQLIIDPKGYDPDDRALTYKYVGWKETYDKICSLEEDEFNCVQILLPEPILTKSQLFTQTKRAINYTTKATDVGLHTITVYVYDQEGLLDYQDVKILVFEQPTAETQTQTIYERMPENITSIEDPITIQGKIEYNSQFDIEYINYTWTIFDSDGNLIETQQIKNQNNIASPFAVLKKIPVEEDTDTLQIIKNLMFNKTGIFNVIFQAGIKYDDEQFKEYVLSEPFEIELNVTQCIPHRSDIAIYPYNILPNPFLANHTCCTDGFTNAEKTTPCYTNTFYGELNWLINKSKNEMKNESLEKYREYPEYSYDLKINLPSPSNNNSIFQMKLNRYCDGNRGNICSGQMIADFIEIKKCNYNQTLLEQCEGSPQNINPTNANNLQCTQYSNKESFETTYNLPNKNGQAATGICQNIAACSTIGANGYGALGGLYMCNAAYCSQGNCTQTFLANCACDVQTCGAECDTQTFTKWETNICKYGPCQNCKLPSSQEIKCRTNQANCYNDKDGFCHYDVDCTTTGSKNKTGDFCQKGVLYKANITTPSLPNSGIVNVCLQGTEPQQNSCDQNGNCAYSEKFFTCGTYNPQCSETVGARCINNQGQAFGATYYNPTPDNIHNYIW